MKYNKRLNWLTSFYGQVADIFPLIVASPRYFAGIVPLGALTQTAGAFAQVQGSLSWFVDAFPTLANWMAVDRPSDLVRRGDGARQGSGRSRDRHHASRRAPADALQVDGVEVRLPERRSSCSTRRASRSRPGETVSVSGPRAAAKRRCFACSPGSGRSARARSARPKAGASCSCRSAPTCRSARCARRSAIPSRHGASTTRHAGEALEDCLLGHLAGASRRDRNWSLALSVGEQQRLAFARALLAEARLDIHRRRDVGARPADGGAPLRASHGAPAGDAIISIAHRAGRRRLPRPAYRHRPGNSASFGRRLRARRWQPA